MAKDVTSTVTLGRTSQTATEATVVRKTHFDAAVARRRLEKLFTFGITKRSYGDASWQSGFAVFVNGSMTKKLRAFRLKNFPMIGYVRRAASINLFSKRKANRRIVLRVNASPLFFLRRCVDELSLSRIWFAVFASVPREWLRCTSADCSSTFINAHLN
jgi:hypothetical protein